MSPAKVIVRVGESIADFLLWLTAALPVELSLISAFTGFFVVAQENNSRENKNAV